MEKNNRNSDWFEIRKGDDTVYAFCEHKHAQWVHSFLILGEKRSVLFDTGLGVCNIEEAIGPHLKTPLLVVNSHAHFDHIGNNWRFPEGLSLSLWVVTSTIPILPTCRSLI